MFERALAESPVLTLVAVGVVCLLVAAAVAVAMDRFIGWGLADPEPNARRAHPFDPDQPTHCDACWREDLRRRGAALETTARSAPANVAVFRPGRWPRI